MIFVFGSNEGGYHGAGAAKTAHEHYGACMGVGYGPTGQAWAIPTKDRSIRRTLLPKTIYGYVMGFIEYAQAHPELEFQVTRVGCGLAGLSDRDMAKMFVEAPDNCLFDIAWLPYLGLTKRYWGTF